MAQATPTISSRREVHLSPNARLLIADAVAREQRRRGDHQRTDQENSPFSPIASKATPSARGPRTPLGAHSCNGPTVPTPPAGNLKPATQWTYAWEQPHALILEHKALRREAAQQRSEWKSAHDKMTSKLRSAECAGGPARCDEPAAEQDTIEQNTSTPRHSAAGRPAFSSASAGRSAGRSASRSRAGSGDDWGKSGEWGSSTWWANLASGVNGHEDLVNAWRNPMGSGAHLLASTAWAAFVDRADKRQELRLEHIPFPTTLELKSVVGGLSGADNRDSIKLMLLRWHPDKFGQKFGTLLRADERLSILERVKQTFQQIQQIRSDGQMPVDLGFFM